MKLLHTYSLLFGHLKSEGAEEFFDGLFKEFVDEFGTHYPHEVEMGSSLFVVNMVTKEEMKRHEE